MKNYEICKANADTIEAIATGDVYELDGRRVTLYDNSDAEEVQYMDEYGWIQTIGAEIWERDAEQVSIYTWINEDVTDVDYIINADHEYQAARLWLTIGGPNVVVDTERGEVIVYADGDSSADLSAAAVGAIDEAVADLWACGC